MTPPMKPPRTTPMTTGITSTSAVVAMLRLARTGSMAPVRSAMLARAALVPITVRLIVVACRLSPAREGQAGRGRPGAAARGDLVGVGRREPVARVPDHRPAVPQRGHALGPAAPPRGQAGDRGPAQGQQGDLAGAVGQRAAARDRAGDRDRAEFQDRPADGRPLLRPDLPGRCRRKPRAAGCGAGHRRAASASLSWSTLMYGAPRKPN